MRLAWLDDYEWNRLDRRSFEIAKAAVKLLRIWVAAEDRDKVKLEDFLVRIDPSKLKREEQEEPKKLPELKLMNLPKDHPLVLQAKARWSTLAMGPKIRKKRRGR